MKLSHFFLATNVVANYEKRFQNFAAKVQAERAQLCSDKIKETRDKLLIQNGYWNCPSLDEIKSNMQCFPQCNEGFKKTWQTNPSKIQPKIHATCYKSPKIEQKNLSSKSPLSCAPDLPDVKPPHPCQAKADTIDILDGALVLTEEISPKRAKFNVVCDDGKVKGEVICAKQKKGVFFKVPTWSDQITWQDSWKGICREFAPLSNSISAGLQTCSESENFPKLAGPMGKIVGGVQVLENEWPWIAQLKFDLNDGQERLCGGSVIANRWVISAAHCCLDVQKVVGRFGDLKTMESDSNEYELEASAWFNHPEYGFMQGDSADDNNDVCLIKFNDDIIASDPESKVQAACLPEADKQHGAGCWVAGWGSTFFGGAANPDLHSVGVNVFSAEYCIASSPAIFFLETDDICAYKPDLNGDGMLDGGAAACNGDSGGPLICPTNGKATLVGLVSRGVGCAWAGFPNKYTSTFVTSSWIKETVAANGL